MGHHLWGRTESDSTDVTAKAAAAAAISYERTTATATDHAEGQGRQLEEPGCNCAGAAKRSYPKSEVRGSGQKELPHL